MEIKFNVTGPKRKEMVKVISDHLGIKAVYQFMPTYAFAIGNLTVSREGALITEENTNNDTIHTLLEVLETAGFHAEFIPEELNEQPPAEEELAETVPTPDEPEPYQGEGSLVISLPIDGFTENALDNLQKLVDSKKTLIQKALGTDALPIETDGDKVCFPWFHEAFDPDTTMAYMQFITSLCKMAKEAKRVVATEKPIDNEKYAFRCFLLRLGFIGNEYKVQRKILLKNLTGSSAFRSGRKEGASA